MLTEMKSIVGGVVLSILSLTWINIFAFSNNQHVCTLREGLEKLKNPCSKLSVLKKIWNEKSQMLSFGCGDKEQIIILASSFNANIANKTLQKKCQPECLNDIVLRECSGRTECHLSYDALLQGSIMQRCPNASKSGNIIIEYICDNSIQELTSCKSPVIKNLMVSPSKTNERKRFHDALPLQLKLTKPFLPSLFSSYVSAINRNIQSFKFTKFNHLLLKALKNFKLTNNASNMSSNNSSDLRHQLESFNGPRNHHLNSSIYSTLPEHHEIYNKTGKHIESNIMENLNITSTKFDGRATKHGLENSRMIFKRKRVSPKREIRQNLTDNSTELMMDENQLNDTTPEITFVSRQMIKWIISWKEPKEISKFISSNKEKFILYLIIFIFIGVWTVTMAIIYRLGQLLEKEKRKATTNNNNKNGNKELIEQQQIDQTADNYHSPGNWRNTESESSTADDRTLRDDEHGDMSNMERSDSRNIMCSNIMSADDRSSKESNTAKMNIEIDDKDTTADKAILQSTSSPESSIMNESTTHQATIISQPSYINANIPLPSPPTSLMFERSSPLQSADANDPSNFTNAEIINYIPIDNDN